MTDEPRMRALLAAFSLLIVTAILGNLIFSLVQGRQNVLKEKSTTAHKLVQVLEEQAASSINAVELALLATTKSMQLLTAQGPARQHQVQEVLENNLRNLPFIRAFWVLDADGNMIHDSQKRPGYYRLGLKVSLDDFGTGYSSLGYLSRFSLDKLKIDQCFVRNITTAPKSAAIAHATIALAHGLGITVIAEGVKTEEQLAYLREAGCDEIQGFLVSPPVPASELAALLTKRAVFSFKYKNQV